MEDEEIGRGILRVLGESPSPLKAHEIRSKLGGRCSRQDVNRVLYKKEHLEVENANPGQTPPRWRLKVPLSAYPAPLNPGPAQPFQTGGVASSVLPHQFRGVAHPGLSPQTGVMPSSVHPPLMGGMATQPLIGGVASSPPLSLIGGVASPAPPPPVRNATSPSTQVYERSDREDGSLIFKPVGATSANNAPHQQVIPGHMMHNPSHMTAGRDVMPGHVTCIPTEETHASYRGEQGPQCCEMDHNCANEVQINNLTSPPANQARGFPSQGAFPGTSHDAANLSAAKEGGMDPANLANSAQKNFPSKGNDAKNCEVSDQLERVANNSAVPSSNSSPSSNAKGRKKKPSVKLAAKFPQASPDTPPSANVSLSSTTPPPPPPPPPNTMVSSSAASPGSTVVPLSRDMQSLDISERSDTKERILRVLREGETSSTEIARQLGMEGCMEELVHLLMKLAEEGKAAKRSEQGKNYWTTFGERKSL